MGGPDKRAAADEGVGDSEQMLKDRIKLAILNSEYMQFSREAGLRVRSDRTVSAAKNALQNPLERTKIKFDEQGRPSYQLIGEEATVAVNPETGVVTSIWPTRTQKARKLKERQKP